MGSEESRALTLLERAREERGWSAEGVAKRLRELFATDPTCITEPNVTRGMVRAWERGPDGGKRPQTRYRLKLCMLYGKSEADLGLDKASWPWPRVRARKREQGDDHADVATGMYAAETVAATDSLPPSDSLQQEGAGNGSANPDRTQPTEEEAEMERQEFLRALMAMGAGTALEVLAGRSEASAPFDVFASAPAKAMQALHRSSVTTGDLRGYERVTSGFARNYATRLDGGPVALVAPMLAHLHTLLLALEQPQPPNTRRRLCVQVTQLNVLLGTAAFDLNNLFVARSYYGSALVAAEQSEEAALCADVLVKTAWAVVGRSTRSVRYADQPERTAARAREALELLGQAQAFADRDASPWTRAQLAGLRAEAYASLGQKQATEASLQQAHRAADGARPGARRYPIEFYDQARLASSEGLCYLRLHEPKLAQAALRASQALQGPTMLINRSIVQLDLAITSFQLRDVDQACEFGDQIPDVGPTHQVIAVRQHTQDLRRELAPYRSVRAVRELDERLRAIA